MSALYRYLAWAGALPSWMLAAALAAGLIALFGACLSREPKSTAGSFAVLALALGSAVPITLAGIALIAKMG